jgi:hypothetical protein
MRRICIPADNLTGALAAETAASGRSKDSSAWRPRTSSVANGSSGGGI